MAETAIILGLTVLSALRIICSGWGPAPVMPPLSRRPDDA